MKSYRVVENTVVTETAAVSYEESRSWLLWRCHKEVEFPTENIAK